MDVLKAGEQEEMKSAEKIGEQFYNLEKRLLFPEVRRSRNELAALLCDDFVEFGSAGEMYDKSAIIAALAGNVARKDPCKVPRSISRNE